MNSYFRRLSFRLSVCVGVRSSARMTIPVLFMGFSSLFASPTRSRVDH